MSLWKLLKASSDLASDGECCLDVVKRFLVGVERGFQETLFYILRKGMHLVDEAQVFRQSKIINPSGLFAIEFRAVQGD